MHDRDTLIALASPWEPVDFVTPAKWRKFVGRRFGKSIVGVFAAWCPSAWYFGIEFLGGNTRGLSVVFGPVLIAFAALRAKAGS